MRRAFVVILCHVIVLLGTLVLTGAAGAGESIRAVVLLPTEGRLAIVDVQSRKVVRVVPVPRGPGPVVAGIDGSRVLVANTRLGLVTEVDGLSGRRLHVFRGLENPIDLVFVPRPEFGLVRPRYAVVAEAAGRVDILDLNLGRIVRRVSVRHPVGLALSDAHLWVASGGSRTLSQLDVIDVARARVVARPNAGAVPVALAPDPSGIAVDAVTRDGRLIRLEAVSLARSVVRRLRGVTTQLLPGYQGVVWAAESDGRVLGVRMSSGRVVDVMHVSHGSRIAIVGGWLAAAHDTSIRMLARGGNVPGATLTLPGRVGAFAFFVS